MSPMRSGYRELCLDFVSLEENCSCIPKSQETSHGGIKKGRRGRISFQSVARGISCATEELDDG
jgi:hypothetical protein